MFEDKYITADELKRAFEEGLDIKEKLDNTSKTSTFKIKAPHFVFRIKDLLQKKYGEDVAKKGWIVTTTLDYCTPDKDNQENCVPGIQQNAEQIIKGNEAELARYGADNSAMLYVDTSNGDVLAYVGSFDYFNDEIDGQVDMIRTKRQS